MPQNSCKSELKNEGLTLGKTQVKTRKDYVVTADLLEAELGLLVF